jgi:Ser/Thr protein kinase RdoA (MazF antagonist)
MTDRSTRKATRELPGSELSRVHSVIPHFLSGQPGETRVARLGDGNINDTYLVEPGDGEAIVLQRINPAVFPEPHRVAENVFTVTTHIARRQAELQDNLSFARSIPTLDGNSFFTDENGDTWRALSYVDDTRTYRSAPSGKEAYEGGRILGCFHHLLEDLDVDGLHEVLPGFHDLPGYVNTYRQALTGHKRSDSNQLQSCCDALERRLADADLLERKRALNTLRPRVIHGDPKCDNFLFSTQSGAAVGLIDLDTVSSGLLLYDLGDCLRSFCNPAGERPGAGEHVHFDTGFCFQILCGYRDSGAQLERPEQDLIYQGVRLLTLELAVRFLTDYLEGDRYFKTRTRRDNLDRAAVQIRLLESIERQKDSIKSMVGDIW